jgi:hypothetical protein
LIRFINFHDGIKEKQFQEYAQKAMKYQKIVNNLHKNIYSLVYDERDVSESWNTVKNIVD